MVKTVMSLYQDPTFQVKEGNNLSDTHRQCSGVRQGCPLSPYLFIIYMNTLMHDLESKFQAAFHHVPSVHSSTDPLFDLEYADDVVLFARSRKVAQFLLNNIQTLAEESGMQLNKNKTALVLMNPQFANKELEVVEQYLHITNLPASTTEQYVKQMFPSKTVTDIEIYLMNPKPGCVRTTVQQAAVRWNSTEPIETQYRTLVFRRKTIKIAPMLAYQLHYGNGRWQTYSKTITIQRCLLRH